MLGIFLILQSSMSKYPTIIEIIGWLSLIAAICLLLIGRNNFQKLMIWVITKIKPYGRTSGLLSTAFGVFLVYAFI